MNESTHCGPLHTVVSMLGRLYVLFTGVTTKISAQPTPEVNKYIYAVWHAQLAFALYAYRDLGVSVLVSKSKDGEYVARIARKLGFNTVRGSTSRNASQSLMELVDLAKAGLPIAITPDGPKGPKEKVQQGIVYVAQKSGREIIPVGIGLSNRIVLNSWDNFEIPLPFGKAALVYSAPIKVSDTDNLEAKAAELEAALNNLRPQAQTLLHN